MTSFHRNGYYRNSKYGVRHWVSRTTVYRADWNRGSYSYAPPPRPRDLFLERYPEFTKTRRVAACFVNPNATCPVCGEGVFYYQNENGSRVFFDELGPPWPKHPCTDTRLISDPFAGTQLGLTFGIRSQPAIAEIMTWQKDRGTNCESEFATKYGSSPWPLATIVKRMKSGKQVFIEAKRLRQGRTTKVYISCRTLPKCCKKGFLIAVGKRKISFIDLSVHLPRIYDRMSEDDWKRDYGGGYFLVLLNQAIQQRLLEPAFGQYWTIWEHLFACLTDRWLSNRANRQLSAKEKIAFLLVHFGVREDLADTEKSRLDSLVASRNRLIHFGVFPKQDAVRHDAMMFIRMTEYIAAKSLGLFPSNVFNTVERLEEFLANDPNRGT